MEKQLPERKSLRLKEFDYSKNGAYFITICTKDRKQLLSRIPVGADVLDGPSLNTPIPMVGADVIGGPSNGAPHICISNRTPTVVLKPYGIIADGYIRQLNEFYQHLSVEQYVIMPDHIHILLVVNGFENGPSRTSAPTDETWNSNNGPSRMSAPTDETWNPHNGPSRTSAPTDETWNFNNGPSRTSAPTRQHSAVSRFVSTFKRFCNKEYGVDIWQRGYHDHIIRNREDYEEVCRYIHDNPLQWQYDHSAPPK